MLPLAAETADNIAATAQATLEMFADSHEPLSASPAIRSGQDHAVVPHDHHAVFQGAVWNVVESAVMASPAV
jgi:hypothetical protein